MSFTLAGIRAFRSLWTPGIFSLIVATIIVTLLSLIGFVLAAGWLLFHLSLSVHDAWLADAISWGGTFGAGLLAWLLFPGIMPVIVSFFDTKIADAIEAQDYPGRPRAQPAGFGPDLMHDLGFSLKAILLNILCLPLYLVPVINLFIFYLLNGYLLGKEFFLMAGRRYMSATDAERLRRRNAMPIFLSGVLLTFLATIPIVNLIAPFWGVALAVHLFHQVYLQSGAAPLAITNA